MTIKQPPRARRKTTFPEISSPSSWPRGVFVVDGWKKIKHREPANERLVTDLKQRNPYEVTNLMKNKTGSYSDINFERRKIKISKTISRGEKYESVVKNGTKTYAGKREVDLNIELQYILKDYILKVYPEVKGKGKDESINLLFLNKKSGGIITTNQVSTWLKEFCKKNEISNKVITSHVLRHTYATRCIESGMQIKVLQKLLGHEDVTTTINTYCDVFTEYEDENIETAQRYFKEKKLTFSDEQEPNN